MKKKSIFFENIYCESKGYRGEKILFDSIKSIFSDKECIAKHGYIMNFLNKKYTIEADVLLIDKQLGINVFEVKGINIHNIISISIDGWHCEGIYKEKINPNYQLDRNITNIIDFLKDIDEYNDSVGIKPIIVLPYISSEQWESKGFNKYAFLPPIIFKDDLKSEDVFLRKMNSIPYKCSAKRSMEESEFNNIKNIFFGKITEEIKTFNVISEKEFLEKLLQ
ncbi:hypothetical protein KQI30_09590 [Clostridium bornimense]|uniref:hypothetical protein n=1 Tax=Clostridium bornimense TaxID=1216932 RepID=UPI001C101623|nr:hypothetical protein [Clostridium bornimense]MBU5316521.1 hypothetical protein [Clostridium bornimense]